MKLKDAMIQKKYYVTQKELPDKMDRRLEAIGLTIGTTISILHKKRRSAMVVKVRGTRFAVGSDIAEHIQVKEVDHHE